MIPEEKAKQLINKYILFTEKYIDGYVESDLTGAKNCAFIVIDEILNEYKSYNQSAIVYDVALNYWNKVKQEIEKL